MTVTLLSNLTPVLTLVAGPATVGVGLAAVLVARLLVGDGGRERAWAWWAAGLGFAVYLAWQLAVLAVLPTGNMDFAAFYRSGREAAAGRDPYLVTAETVALNPPPAIGLFRVVSALPYPAAGVFWSVVTAALVVPLVPLANRLLAADHADDGDAPPALPRDAAALLGAALVNSNASLWGHRAGQLCALTAVSIGLALRARQRGRPWLAGAALAVAAFKPATLLPFLVLFLRKRDLPSWLAMAAASAAFSLAAAPPGRWADLVAHNLERIKAYGEPGMINDYDFPRAISSDLVAFNHLLHRGGLRDRRLIAGLQAAGVAALLAVLFAVRNRRPFTAAASVVAAGSMLVLYHRMYDAVVLALPLAFASSVALRASGRRRAWAVGSVVLMLAVTDQPREALIGLTRWSLDRGLPGRVVQAVVLPYATWALLIVLPGLASCGFARHALGNPQDSPR